MTIWFTSDTHFNHENIIQHSKRPFRDLEHMTEELVSRWNACVAPGDTIYHLGDFALSWGKKHAEIIDSLLARLNGNKWLIVGNHDRKEVVGNSRWAGVAHYHELKLNLGGEHKQRIVMCHYPLRSWNQMHRGAWMLHGHCHGSLQGAQGKILDVGVDVHDFKPISLESVQETMEKHSVVCVDHHVESLMDGNSAKEAVVTDSLRDYALEKYVIEADKEFQLTPEQAVEWKRIIDEGLARPKWPLKLAPPAREDE